MSREHKEKHLSEGEDSFPEENELEVDNDKSKLEMLESTDQEEDSQLGEESIQDLLSEFFLNENGDNVANILTGIQNSIDQNSKCILKLTKVLQEFLNTYAAATTRK
jgi:hypothetical protein